MVLSYDTFYTFAGLLGHSNLKFLFFKFEAFQLFCKANLC
jgi:hypothetical protein